MADVDPTSKTPAGDAATEALAAAQAAIASLKNMSQTPAVAAPARGPSEQASSDALAGVQAAIAAARAGPATAPPPPPPPPPQPVVQVAAQPFQFPSFSQVARSPHHEGIDLLADVHLHVKIELGRTRMLVEDVLRLGEGSVVELDKLAGDPVDVYVNERLIARGEVLVLSDNFCVRVNEIVASPHVDG